MWSWRGYAFSVLWLPPEAATRRIGQARGAERRQAMGFAGEYQREIADTTTTGVSLRVADVVEAAAAA
jgi:hypothetical protein